MIDQCKMIDFPKISDERGSLSVVESNQHVPFEIKRVFYMYNIVGGGERGAHAHKELHQVIVAISGSFDVTVDDGHDKKNFHMENPWQALHIPPMIWATESNFSGGAVCMVFASDHYDEADYYRDYEDFLAAVQG